jgi:hypothetical protein
MNPRVFCREPGYDRAVLLTYDFDALFFERVILRDLWAGGATDIQVIADLGRVTEAVTRWVGQARMLGRHYQLTCATLRGAFHPKMIIRSGPKGAAVWIGSGNITYGGWGSNLEVGTAWRTDQESADRGGWLAEILVQLSEWLPVNEMHTTYRRIIDTPWLADAMGTSTNRPVLISRRGVPIGEQLISRWRGRRFDQVILITGSTDEHGALLSWFHKHLGVSRATVLLDPATAAFNPVAVAALPLKTLFVALNEPRRVHAKFYWFEGTEGSAAVTGSANCSSAAWLRGPEAGGNVETVLVYDHPSRDDFEPILSRIAKETKPAKLTMPQTKVDDEPKLPAYSLAAITWEKANSEITIFFTRSLPSGAEVTLRICDERVVCRPHEDAMTWVAGMPTQAANMHGTLFGEVSVTFADGQIWPNQPFWIDDLEELRNSASGREFGNSIRNLSASSTTSEQRRIVAELQKIGSALLHDASSFPDPLPRPAKISENSAAKVEEHEAQPIDPDHLIRSLDEQTRQVDRMPGASSQHGVTLMGVIRVLFESDDEGLEDEVIETPEEDTGDEDERSDKEVPKDKPPRISKTARERLYEHMNEFLERLGDNDFAEKCTVTQMVQATAYPLAVIACGTSGKWVDVDIGREWATRVFDILFREHYSNGDIGLLQRIQRRCEANGQTAAFQQRAGDGTLWVAMLDSIWKTVWVGVNGGLKKAFAMRAVLESRPLLASAEAGQMAILVSILERRRSSARLLLSFAQRAKRILAKMENLLCTRWGWLMSEQAQSSLPDELGDALYHPTGGWAFVTEEAATMDGTKLRVYRQNRAGEILIKSNFYLNVTKTALWDADLSNCLQELDWLVKEIEPGAPSLTQS